MYTDILRFWFEEIDESRWWEKDEAFDKHITDRFLDVHSQAVRGELFEWRVTEEGWLAEIIVLDQFSRNIYRDTPLAFASDAQALALAQQAVAQGVDKYFDARKRSFFYLPYMHSESQKIHKVALTLYEQHGTPSGLEFEKKHKAIIDRFGRYPHRNEILGRISTQEELAFLEQPGSGF